MVDSYVSGDDYCMCDNCSRPIKNVAVLQAKDNDKINYCVGLDCAQTLLGVNDYDMEYYNQPFILAKTLMAKINSAIKKKPNHILMVKNRWYKPNELSIIVAKTTAKTTAKTVECLNDSFGWFHVDIEFAKKYLPKYYALTNIVEYTPVTEIPVDCKYTFVEEFISNGKLTLQKVSIYLNGVILDTDSQYTVNKGDVKIKLYNKTEFERLRK